jgi:polyisoprenoid-binding protein YceI
MAGPVAPARGGKETAWWERGIRLRAHLAILLLLGSLAPATAADRRPIDTGHSRVFVRVYKTGLFSALAHDHRIEAPIASGSVELGEHAAVELKFETRNLRVLDPEVPADTRQQIQESMLGPKVLDAARYPEILFVSKGVTSTGRGNWRVDGNLTLHGQTHPVSLDVSETGGVYEGSVEIQQSDFGITPLRIAGGTVKVKDAVKIRFEIRLENSAQPNERKTSRIP